jgi:PAS domain S-box-containing protein
MVGVSSSYADAGQPVGPHRRAGTDPTPGARLEGSREAGDPEDRLPAADPDDLTFAAAMAEAGRILGSSLDTAATLRQIADLIVPRVADWCAIDLLDADGRLSPVAIAHRDPSKMALVERLRKVYPPEPDAPVGSYAVIAAGEPMVLARIDDEMLRRGAKDDEHFALLRELGLRSWMAAPMTSSGGALGTIAFAGAESGPVFGPRHLAFAVDLASRAGAALENARAFHAADRFRRLLDAVAESVFVVDPGTWVIADVNEGAASLLGVPRDRVVGRVLWDLVEPASVAAAERRVRRFENGEDETATVALRFRRDDRPPIPTEVIVQRVELLGESPLLVAIARDVRERVEAQGRLERLARAEHARAAELDAVIRAMGDGVIVCGPDGRIILANPAGRRMFPDVIERTYDDILGELRDPDRLAPALGGHGGPVALPTRRGPERWIEVSSYPVSQEDDTDGSGETIIVLRDVTVQREREAVRETFIGVLSHELRTPVTTIFGAARVLSRPDSHLDAATRQEILEDVADEAERLRRLVEDVVAMSRFGETSADLWREPVLLQRVVPSVVGLEEHRWPGVQFSLDIPSGLPTVMADPTYLEQIIRNLLANAAKYGGPAASVHVRIDLSDAGDEALVHVLDDGPGIEPSEADRLFDLFYRSPRTASETSGAGIGLFVCSRLVRAMGGRVWAAPRDEGGAEFGFALQVLRDDDGPSSDAVTTIGASEPRPG